MTQANDALYHIGVHAQRDPNRAAVINGNTGAVLTFAQLNEQSTRLARFFRARGFRRGDHIAVLMENCATYYVACWAAMRSGLYFTPVNSHLTPDEVAYIVNDCGAKALVVSAKQMITAQGIAASIPNVAVKLVDGPAQSDFVSLQSITDADSDSTPALDESEGYPMFYSSGTTGRPKGIKRPLPETAWGTLGMGETFLSTFYQINESTVYLCPAPLYHAAPLVWSMLAQRMGGTVVMMEKFDALQALQLIERYKVTLGQFVPTMFVRMLNLPEEVRKTIDVSSLKIAVHAAAPCPVDIKRKMIDWFGPVINEYYAGSEGNGMCTVGSADWLAHPGTVGKPLFGEVHIVDEEGNELPSGEIGAIYFGGTPPFEYHNDPVKTASAVNAKGWSTLGDIGYIDAEGYVYLSDRRTDLIISGGVNIYPRETEEALLQHPSVLDVAVVGVLNPDFGEEVLAVVELKEGVQASAALAEELMEFSRGKIAHYKCPRRIEFDALPRTPTGKLLRRQVKERYRQSAK